MVRIKDSSLAFAQKNIADLLPFDDHKRVDRLVNKLRTYHLQEEKYYLHGDTGVHNFVFLDNKINGVIDPSPLIGPKIYDFTYAFCSSPDNLNMITLLSSFSKLIWKHGNSGENIFPKYDLPKASYIKSMELLRQLFLTLWNLL